MRLLRRLAVAGFVAFAPDALTPLGGYPGSDDEGRTHQTKRKGEEMTENFVGAAKWLHAHALCNGKVGAVGPPKPHFLSWSSEFKDPRLTPDLAPSLHI